MLEELELGLFLFFSGIFIFVWGLKSLKKFRKEKYDPFKERKSVIKPRVYFQSQGMVVLGSLLTLIGFLYILDLIFIE